MEHVKINTGSNVKGYAVPSVSDNDYIVFEKCSKEQFLNHILEVKHIKNKHCKIKGDDVVLSNLYTALRGIYYGNYAHLAVFARQEDFNGDMSMFRFVKDLAQLRLPLILKTMIFRHKIIPNITLPAKTLLSMLYNLSYVEYVLNHGVPDNVLSMPNMLPNEDKVQLYLDLMQARSADAIAHGTMAQVKTIWAYRDRMLAVIEQMPAVEPRRDIEIIMCNHFLNKTPLYIPRKNK
jgi:hypothetical protein